MVFGKIKKIVNRRRRRYNSITIKNKRYSAITGIFFPEPGVIPLNTSNYTPPQSVPVSDNKESTNNDFFLEKIQNKRGKY